jgi:3-oxoacyl-[acyl-carrier-protein] synthase-1
VYAGAGVGGYQNEYEFFPLLTAAKGDLDVFGRELAATVHPMWLLRSMPNNVVCHVGIRHGLKGPNACVTNHSVSGSLAVAEAAAALRAGEADRALAIGHDAPIEPQVVLYYHQLGLMAADAVRPFDAGRSGSLLGEGAAALLLETDAAAADRGAPVLGEFPGQRLRHRRGGAFAHPRRRGRAGERDRDGPRGRRDAPGRGGDDRGARERHASVGRHGGAGHPARVRGDDPARHRVQVGLRAPLAASGILDSVLALLALRHRAVPGVGTLRELDPELGSFPVSAKLQAPRGDVALVLNRSFGGSNTATALPGRRSRLGPKSNIHSAATKARV